MEIYNLILGEFRRFYMQILGEICKTDNNDMEILGDFRRI